MAPMLMRHGGDKTKSSSKDVKVGFIVLFVVTIATAIYAVATSHFLVPAVLVLVGIALFLLAPHAIPIGVGFKELMSSRKTQQKLHDLEAPEKFEVVEDLTKEEEDFEKAIVGVKEEVEWTQLWKKLDFWIYCGLYLFGPTLGQVFMNNLGQITESRGSTATTSLVALSSSLGFFGRLLPSLLDYFSRSKYMPSSPVSMAVSCYACLLRQERGGPAALQGENCLWFELDGERFLMHFRDCERIKQIQSMLNLLSDTNKTSHYLLIRDSES